MLALEIVIVDMSSCSDGLCRDADRPAVLQNALAPLDRLDRHFMASVNRLPDQGGINAVLDRFAGLKRPQCDDAVVVGMKLNPSLGEIAHGVLVAGREQCGVM